MVKRVSVRMSIVLLLAAIALASGAILARAAFASSEDEQYGALLSGAVSTAWATCADAAASGGSFSSAELLSDAAYDPLGALAPEITVSKRPQLLFRFYGDSLTWLCEKGPAYGIARLYVDGIPFATVDQYASSSEAQAATAISGLAADAYHVLRIVSAGTKNVASSGYAVSHDAFVGRQDPGDAATRVAENDAGGRTLYTWAIAKDDGASGEAYAFSDAAGASTSYVFTGDSVTWLYGKGPLQGKAHVTIDGVDKGLVDQYAPTFGFRDEPLVTDDLGLRLAAALAKDGAALGNNTDPTSTWKDLGPDGLDVTLTGFSWTGTHGWTGDGSSADPYRLNWGSSGGVGYGSQASSASLAPQVPLTFAAWTKISQNRSSISSFFYRGSTSSYIWFRNHEGDGCACLQVDQDGSSRIGLVGSIPIDDGSLHYVAVTLTPTGHAVYVDGVLDTGAWVAYGGDGSWAPSYGSNPGYLGRYTTNEYKPKGGLCELQYYSRALSAGEIAKNYAAGPSAAVTTCAATYSGLDSGAHTITITSDAAKNASSGGYRLVSDAFVTASGTLQAESAAAPVNPVLTVTAPDGGEEYVTGSDGHDVDWDLTDPVDSGIFSVSAVSTNEGGQEYSLGTVDAVVNQTSYSLPWTITQPSGDYKIRVRYARTEGVWLASDESDAAFSLVDPAISVTSPTGDSTSVNSGDHVNIAWSTADPPEVGSFAVTAVSSGGQEYALGTVTADTGQRDYSLDWTVSQPVGDAYRVRVVYTPSGGGAAVTGWSDGVVAVQMPLTVTSPASGAHWHYGSQYTLNWTLPSSPVGGTGFVVYVVTFDASGNEVDRSVVAPESDPIAAVPGQTQYSAAWTASICYSSYAEVHVELVQGAGVRVGTGSASFILDPSLSAPTHVSGTISQNTTWSLAGSPYILDGMVTVSSGATLTVEPGVVVKATSGYVGIDVYGALVADSIAHAPITFTSLKDDTVCGDTNGDGSASGPARGDWAGLRIETGGVGTLDRTVVRYAGCDMYWSHAGVSLWGGGLTLTDSQILDTGSGSGLYAYDPADLRLENDTIARSDADGVYLEKPHQPFTITGNTIQDNGSYGMEILANDGTSSLSNVTLHAAGSEGNRLTGNGRNCVRLAGSVRSNWRLPAFAESSACYETSGDLVVTAGATLTIDRGVVVKDDASARGIYVEGSLIAQGTGEEPITFTSSKDDTVAGDTNGDGSATGPAAGNWAGICSASGGTCTLAHVAVQYAGRAVADRPSAAIYSYYGAVSLTDSQILDCNGHGFYAYDAAAVTLQNSTIARCLQNGVFITRPHHPFAVTGNSIRDNSGYGMWLEATDGTSSLSNIALHAEGSDDNRLTGNHNNCVRLQGPLDSNWTLHAFPEADEACYVNCGLTVAAGTTLTVDPNVVIKSDGSPLSVFGSIVGLGTARKQIIFTSFSDDSVCGDTNGDGSESSAAPGDWGGIHLAESAASGNLSHVVLHYAGSPVIEESPGAAVTVEAGSSLEIHYSNIVGNYGYGVWAAPGSFEQAHAEHNWWGSASGPYPHGQGQAISSHPEPNPNGGYDEVIDVSAVPWLGMAKWEGASLGRSGWCGYAADPVNVATGNFTYETTDVSVPTRGLALEATRTYNSLLTQDSPFGQGWSFSYNLRIKTGQKLPGGDEEYVAVTREDGGQQWYRENADGSYEPPRGVFDTLAAVSGGGYTLTTKDHQVYAFGSNGRLTSITDRNGNATTVGYGANGISTIAAPDGRTLDLVCNADGHIETLTDPHNRTWHYSYESGNLHTVTDPAGGITTYTYDTDGKHRLETIVDANDHTSVRNHYDENGRVDWQEDALQHRTTYAYELVTGRTFVTNVEGNTEVYVSNSYDCLVSLKSFKGNVTTYAYDEDNNRTRVTDPLGHATRYAYDDRGNVLKTINAAGDESSVTYNAFSEPLTKIDYAGNTWTYHYDDDGNLTETISPPAETGGPPIVTSNTYYANGKLKTSTDACQRVTQYEYNANGDLIKTTLPSAPGTTIETTADYDAVGRATLQENALGKQTTTVYDDEQRTVTTTDPLNRSVVTTNDPVGNKIRVENARHIVTEYTYDECNNQKTMTVASGTDHAAMTSYAYDDKNRLEQVTDANLHVTVYDYDDDGNRISKVVDPLGLDPNGLNHTSSRVYDPAGNVYSSTDGKNQTTTYTYDELNRLKTIDKPGDAPTVTFTYDKLGNRKTMVDGRGTTAYHHNALGWLTSVTTPDGTPDGKTVSYDYYADGKRHHLTYSDARQAVYAYDPTGALESVTGPAGDETSYTYYADGSLHTTTLPNGVTGTRTYDDAGQLQTLTYSSSGTLLAITYTDRNANGDPTIIDDSLLGRGTYHYDPLDQLTEEARGGSTIAYDYDPVGNRTLKTAGGVTTTYDYDAANELMRAGEVTYTYDGNGSREARMEGSETTTYTWNSDNRLTGTSSTLMTTSYAYDGEGQRVSATENGAQTDFVLDTSVGDEVVLEETTGEDTSTYTYGAGLISREASDGSIRYLLADGLGSVRLETDETGAVVREHSYDAYGIEQGTSDLSGNRFRFTGQWSDGTGLSFLRARFYDPETGAFLSVDPVPSADSRYIYCGNNPVLRIDPSGMFYLGQAISDGLKGLANCIAGAANAYVSAAWQSGMVLGPIPALAAKLLGIAPPRVPAPFHGSGLGCSYGIGNYVVGPAAMGAAGGLAEAGASASSVKPPRATLYLDITKGKSVPNRLTTVPHDEFISNLIDDGWVPRQVGEEGAVTLLEKDGAQYSVRETNSSGWPGWTADFTPAGGSKTVEIRLGAFTEVQ